MGRGTIARRGLLAAFVAFAILAPASLAVGQLPAVSEPQAIERFRVAAALQNRELYDLAADDWAAFCREFPADPLAATARYQRGVCLFRLQRYDEARAELERLVAGETAIEPALAEQCYAQLGLAHFNLAIAAEEPTRGDHLRKSIAAFDRQLASHAGGKLAPQSAFYRCESLYAVGDLASAIDGYRQLLANYPDHPQRAEAMYALGVAEQEHGELAAAAATFENLVATFPQHELAADARVHRGESLLALGSRLLQSGEAEQAVVVLESAAALPRWEQADVVLLALADAEFRAAKPQAAVRVIDRLLAELPESGVLDRAYWRRGESYAACGEWPAAVDDYTTLVDRWPGSSLVRHALVARARAQLHCGDARAAENSLDRCLQGSADDELAMEACLLRATVRHQRGNFAAGIADADALLAQRPPRSVQSDALYVRGLCQLGLRDPAAATESFEQIVQQDPHYGSLDRVLYDLAWAHQESHDAARATATYARLAESHPASPLAAEALYRIGEVHFAAGDYTIAADKFRSAIERAVDPAVKERSAHKLAWCLFELQDFPAAERAFGEQLAAHSQGPLATDGQLMQAECQYRQNKFRDALESFSHALEAPNATPALRQSALLHAAQSAARTEQWERCLNLADRAIAEFPNAGWVDEVRCERGTALFHLRRLDDAQRELAALAGNGDPTGARAEFMIGRIQATRGDHEAAIRSYFKVAYGYGAAAPAAFRTWQAESLYEAAQCLQQTNRADSARRLYEELIDRYPTSAQAPLARQALQQSLRR